MTTIWLYPTRLLKMVKLVLPGHINGAPLEWMNSRFVVDDESSVDCRKRWVLSKLKSFYYYRYRLAERERDMAFLVPNKQRAERDLEEATPSDH